jgi:hypothetical protein
MEDREPTLLLAKKFAIKALAELSPASNDDLLPNSRRSSSGSFARPALANAKTAWLRMHRFSRNSTAGRNEPKLSQNFCKFAAAFPDQIFSEIIQKRFSVFGIPTYSLQPSGYIGRGRKFSE